jgi:hypothetical protein
MSGHLVLLPPTCDLLPSTYHFSFLQVAGGMSAAQGFQIVARSSVGEVRGIRPASPFPYECCRSGIVATLAGRSHREDLNLRPADPVADGCWHPSTEGLAQLALSISVRVPQILSITA